MDDRPAANELAARLREARRDRGLGLRQAANLIGVSHSTLKAWLSGESYPQKAAVIRGVARFLDVAEREIEEWSPAMTPDVSERYVPAPLVEHVRMEAGEPVGDTAYGYWYAVKHPEERSHQFRTFVVSGDCMAPRIEAGDEVVVDLTRRNDWRADDLVALLHGGTLLVKRVRRTTRSLIFVADDGTTVRPDDSSQVVGVVVEIRKRP